MDRKGGVGQPRTNVFLYSHAEDLSLKATGIPTLFHPPIPPRERPLRLTQSDSKALQIIRMSKQNKSFTRRTSEQGLSRLQPPNMVLPPPPPPAAAAKLVTTLRPLSSSLMSPLHLPSSNTLHQSILPPIVTSKDKLYTIKQESITSTSEDDDSSESLIDDVDSDLFISGIGFRDDSYSSLTALTQVDFPSLTNTMSSYPVTLLMEHYLIEHQSRLQGIQPSGHNPRINNIVRAFEIKGTIDKDLLQQSLSKVVTLHPLLMATFTVQSNGQYHLQTSQGAACVKLEVSISYEKSSELITLARRKLFDVTLKHDYSAIPPPDGYHDDTDDILSIISYREELPLKRQSHTPLPALPIISNESGLIQAKLVTKSEQESVLILSFSRIVCDYWSSCLFMQQLVDAYTKLCKASTYKPSLTALRQIKTSHNRRMRSSIHLPIPCVQSLHKPATNIQLRSTPRAHFQQVCLRERQILIVRPKEKLWTFWEANITSTINRTRGPPRIKVIPPLRIPSGFGQVLRTSVRPTTSRLRPLTARYRPPTARNDRVISESLTGQQTGTLSIRVNERIGYDIIRHFPDEYLSKIDQKEILGIVTLCAYIILLARCCRGWAGGVQVTQAQRGDQPAQDPLLKYHEGSKTSPPMHTRAKKRCCKLDTGSFLIGVDVSVRQLAYEVTQGLIGPLNNNIGLRVDLSSYECFADMVLSLWTSLHHCRCNGHYPFHTIAEEVGLVYGLPVRFSFFNSYDVQQLSNPDGFYFMETSVGVEQKALSRMGACYINPLNTKADDTCQLELFAWEGVRGETIDGLFIYQKHLLQSDVMNSFSHELLQILKIVSQNPLIELTELGSHIKPPFTNTGLREH